MKLKQAMGVCLLVMMAIVLISTGAKGAEPIKIGIIQGLSGPYEVYGKQEVTGFKMGLELSLIHI